MGALSTLSKENIHNDDVILCIYFKYCDCFFSSNKIFDIAVFYFCVILNLNCDDKNGHLKVTVKIQTTNKAAFLYFYTGK